MEPAGRNNPDLGKWLAGAAVGAAVMYLLDPERGAPRRAASGMRLRELGRQTGEVAARLAHGLASQAGQSAASGRTLVHTALSAARQAAAIAPAGQHAASTLPPQFHHTDAAGQQPAPLSMAPIDAGGTGLGPARTALVAGGGLLGLYGLLAPRSMLSGAAGLAGLALFASGVGRRPVRAALRSGQHTRPVEIEKTIRINAPPDKVYDLFANYENFPRFLSNVMEVRDLGNDRSHWVVKGPAGTRFTWNAILTEHHHPHRLAWQSEAGGDIVQLGAIELTPFRDSTRVTVHLSYHPPAGALGHAFAKLFKRDPGHQLQDDLACMKQMAERDSGMPAMTRARDAQHTVLH